MSREDLLRKIEASSRDIAGRGAGPPSSSRRSRSTRLCSMTKSENELWRPTRPNSRRRARR